MSRGFKTVCGVHEVRASRSDVTVAKGCPYCRDHVAHVREEQEQLALSLMSASTRARLQENSRRAQVKRKWW